MIPRTYFWCVFIIFEDFQCRFVYVVVEFGSVRYYDLNWFTGRKKKLLKVRYCNDYARDAVTIFNAQFPDKNIQTKYMIELCRKFAESVWVQN